MGIEEAKKAAMNAQGFLSEAEGRLLYRLARNCRSGDTIVEIGSWKGRSTIWLAFGSRDGAGKRIAAIDPHTSSPEMPQGNSLKEFMQNLRNAGVEEMVEPIVKTSEEAALGFKGDAEFVFIDGDHSYGHAKQDFELWFPKVLEHGIMAFHDTMLVPGPKKVVHDLVFNSRHFRNIGFVDSITFAEKVRENTAMERLKNRRVLLLKGLFTLASRLNNAVGLPKPLKTVGKKAIGKMQ
ncbi:MAG: class I SAM-dependent methyltransferase [archaeon]